MKVLRLSIFAIFIFFGTNLKAQELSFKGLIQDAHTKEPVPYASVYFEKSGIGKISDSAGNFSFYFSSFAKDSLVVSYVGYQTFKLAISDSMNNKTILIQLMHSANTGVVVKTKINKGLFLWHKIMSKKKMYNRQNLTNFGYEAYNKLEVDIKNFNPEKAKRNFMLKPFSFVFDNVDSTSEKDPFLPAYLLETLSDYAYQKNSKKYFENIKASSTKGFANESITKYLGVMNQNVNIYGNYVNVMDKDFISPFNDNADAYYNFSVPDTQTLGTKKIFHFVFSPKHIGQNTFEGDAWVIGKTFQIQKINLFLGKDANINYIDRISVFQEFTPINDTIYFLTRDKFFADFRVLGKNSLTLIGRKTTSYKNIAINSDSITNLFKQQNIEEVTKITPGSNLQTDAAWKTLRHDSLSKDEKAIYETVDKLLKMPKFQKLEDNIRFLGAGYKKFGNFEIGPWYNWLSLNGWEGYRPRFDLGTTTGFNKNIYLHGYLAYGLTDKKFKGKAEAYWLLQRAPSRIRLHLAYTDDINNEINPVGEVSQDNIFSLAIRKPNTTRKYLALKDLRFEVYHELGKGFSAEWFFTHRQFDPLKNLPFKSSFPVSSGEPLNNFEVSLKLRFAYLEKFFEDDYFRYSLGSKYPIVEFIVSKGIPGIFNSAYNNTKFGASISDVVKIMPFGSFSYKAYAGKINGTLPFAFLENLPGNDFYYYSPSSFNLMNRFEYLADRFAGLNIEHHIGSGLFRFIPVTRKLKLRQFWNAKMVWGGLSAANDSLNNANGSFKTLNGKQPYMEIGTGIDNILKVFRIDFVWRVMPTPLPANKVSRFGVFGSFQFQF